MPVHNISGMNILSVDDNANNLAVIVNLTNALSLNVYSYENPIEALESTLMRVYDLVIVDYMMPEMNGLDFIEAYRKKNPQTPVIMVTASGDDMGLQIKALQLGANDFLSKPINSVAFQARIRNSLQLRRAQLLLEDKSLLLQDEVEKAINQIKEHERETLHILGKSAQFKDPETGEHTQRVAHFSRLLAKEAGLSKKMQDIIFYASPFHDLGKVGIPDRILLKEDKLDEDESAIMKTHVNIGYNILKNAKSSYLKAGAVIAYSHHEKFDGSGYPIGLSGQTIPILGRIVAITDVFDALTSPRSYKEAWSLESAFAYLEDEKGKHFDPELVDLFIACQSEIQQIKERYRDEDTQV